MVTLTVQHIRAMLAEIKSAWDNGEDDVAHMLEDSLMVDTLDAIQHGAPNARELASAALESYELDFDRTCSNY